MNIAQLNDLEDDEKTWLFGQLVEFEGYDSIYFNRIGVFNV